MKNQPVERKPKLTTTQLDLCLTHMLRDQQLFDFAKQHFQPSDFNPTGETRYALLWAAALAAAERNGGKLPSPGTDVAIIGELDGIAEAGIAAGAVTPEARVSAENLLVWIFNFDPARMNASYYKTMIQDMIVERTVIGKLSQAMTLARDVGRPIDIIKDLNAQVTKLQSVLTGGDQAGSTAFPVDFKPKKVGKFSTGLPFMDKFMNGGQAPKEVYAVLGPTGLGKCWGKGTPILMYDGTILPVEEVTIGSMVMGPDSSPRTVTSLACGCEQMYRVVPTKGEEYIVNGSHILSLWLYTDHCPSTEAKYIELSVSEYLTKSNNFRHSVKGWRTGIDFITKPISVDPYFLGLWLGDGTSESTQITTTDAEIVTYINNYATQLDMHVSVVDNDNNKCSRYRITNGHCGGKPNLLLDQLRVLGLVPDKFVPHNYKTNSRNIRLAVLAGLLDSDGEMHDAMFVFSNKNRQLAHDVAYLARSLGLAAYIKPTYKSCQTGAIGLYYVVNISGDCSIVPTRLTRKKAPHRRQRKNVLRHGITVEPLGIGAYYGFTLDGPDGRCMLGDFTVTHNTTMGIMMSVLTARQWNAAFLTGAIPRRKVSCFFSWEQSLDQLRLRFWSFAGTIDSTRLESFCDEQLQLSCNGNYAPYETSLFAKEIVQEKEQGRVQGAELERLATATEELGDIVRIFDFSGSDEDNPQAGQGGLDEVSAALRKVREEGYDIGVVVIDYAKIAVMRYMSARGEDMNNTRHYLGSFCNEARFKIANEFNCPVWIFQQLNTEANRKAPGVKQHHSYASECGTFAENVWFAFVFSTKDEKNKLTTLFCTKSRRASGEVPPAILKIEGQFCRMSETVDWYHDGSSYVPATFRKREIKDMKDLKDRTDDKDGGGVSQMEQFEPPSS